MSTSLSPHCIGCGNSEVQKYRHAKRVNKIIHQYTDFWKKNADHGTEDGGGENNPENICSAGAGREHSKNDRPGDQCGGKPQQPTREGNKVVAWIKKHIKFHCDAYESLGNNFHGVFYPLFAPTRRQKLFALLQAMDELGCPFHSGKTKVPCHLLEGCNSAHHKECQSEDGNNAPPLHSS